MDDRQRLRKQIGAAFTLDELASLCVDLNIDPDDVPGKNSGESSYIDNLLLYVEKRDHVERFMSALRAQRPNMTWVYAPPVLGYTVSSGLFRREYVVVALCVIALLGLGAFLIARNAPAVPRGSNTVVPTVPTVPTAAVTNQTPEPMPAGSLSIFVANFETADLGDAGQFMQGDRISSRLVEALNAELQDSTVIPADARADFKPVVWTAQDARQRGFVLPPVRSAADAEATAAVLGAQLVIYGTWVTSSTPQLEFGFYLPRSRNTADELSGRFVFGEPIRAILPLSADAEKGLELTINERQRVLVRLALGLAYDAFGRQERALAIFTDAETRARSLGVAQDVTAFLVGREHLLLGQTQEAEAAHRRAVDNNNDFVRAYLGLGDVYFQYAAVMTDAVARLDSGWLDRSRAAYVEASQKAAQRESNTGLASVATLGIGLVDVLKANTLFDLDRTDEAAALYGSAAALIELALNDMAQRPEGQARTLALGYFNLALAYRGSARLAGASDTVRSAALYKQALTAFDACIKLDAGADKFLSEKIRPVCESNRERMLNLEMN